jgi:hypothetical protein
MLPTKAANKYYSNKKSLEKKKHDAMKQMRYKAPLTRLLMKNRIGLQKIVIHTF